MLLNILLIWLMQSILTATAPPPNFNESSNILLAINPHPPAKPHAPANPNPPTPQTPSGKTAINPYDASTYNGDVLNVTKCYCQDPHDAQRKGYHYVFDYYNWHSNRFYQTHKTCDSRKHMNYLGMKWIPECWGDKGFKEFAMNYEACDTQYSPDFHKRQGNFCTQLQGIRIANVNWTTWDIYRHDFQYRTVQNMRSWFDMDANVCRDHCEQKLPGMVLAEDQEGSLAMTMKGPGDTFVLQNEYTSYTDLDDMCKGCR